jgi:hypothetical protein
MGLVSFVDYRHHQGAEHAPPLTTERSRAPASAAYLVKGGPPPFLPVAPT